MENFKPNSHRVREEESPEKKKVEKVISGKAKTKKKSYGQKFAEVFISEDVNSVKSYILSDVLIPALKDTLYDAFTSGLSMLLGGGVSSSGYRRTSTNSRESYSQYYKSGNKSNSSSRTRNERYDYNDVILDSRAEAEEVLDVLVGLCEEYSMVTLADLYDAVGASSNYTDNKYGWYDLKTASVVRTRDGYMLKLPRISLID